MTRTSGVPVGYNCRLSLRWRQADESVVCSGVALHNANRGSAVQLPRGTVHIVVNEARAAAIRLGVPFAPVVVGARTTLFKSAQNWSYAQACFHREHGQVKPKYGGAVVWKRDEDAVLEGIAVEKERLQTCAAVFAWTWCGDVATN
eukprot:2489603-Amphidinium_carterae.2